MLQGVAGTCSPQWPQAKLTVLFISLHLSGHILVAKLSSCRVLGGGVHGEITHKSWHREPQGAHVICWGCGSAAMTTLRLCSKEGTSHSPALPAARPAQHTAALPCLHAPQSWRQFTGVVAVEGHSGADWGTGKGKGQAGLHFLSMGKS